MEDIVLICCVALGKSLTSLNLSPSLVRWRRQVWRDKGVHHEGDIVLETGTSHLFLYIKGNQENKSQSHGTVTHEHRHSRQALSRFRNIQGPLAGEGASGYISPDCGPSF